MVVCGQRYAPAVLPRGMRFIAHFTGVCVVPRVGVDGYKKSRPSIGFRYWTVHPTEDRYIDWAIPTNEGKSCNWKNENDYLKFELHNKIKQQFCRPLKQSWPPYTLVRVSDKFRSSECSVLGPRLKAPLLRCFSSFELKFYLRSNLAIDLLGKQSLDWKIHYFFVAVL